MSCMPVEFRIFEQFVLTIASIPVYEIALLKYSPVQFISMRLLDVHQFRNCHGKFVRVDISVACGLIQQAFGLLERLPFANPDRQS